MATKFFAPLTSYIWIASLYLLSFQLTAFGQESLVCESVPLGEAIQLRNGIQMPRVGFGTAGMRGELAQESVSAAIQAGFRHFDGAEAKEWYDDAALGQAIKQSGIERDQFFITTKVSPKNFGRSNTKKAIASMLDDLQTDYIDLLLLHFRECWDGIPSCRGVKVEGSWFDSWQVLEDYYRNGRVKAIGISNFHYDDIVEAIKLTSIKPHVVQNWMDPFHQDARVRELCRDNQIAYTSYSALGTQWRKNPNPVISNKEIGEIGRAHDLSSSEVVLRWLLAKNVVILPRSTNPIHIRENAKLINILRNNEMEVKDKECSDPEFYFMGLSATEIETIDKLDGTI